MITKTDLEAFSDHRSAAGRVLSVYLDVDQSKAANMNRGFERAFDTKVREIAKTFEEQYEEQDFDECVEDVRKFLSFYEPKARGLVVFARSAGTVWIRELNVPLVTDVRWGHAPYIHQFVEALDEFETYAVVVVDRSHSRIFTVKLGTMEKQAEVRAMQGVRHVKTTGTDRLFSQSHFQKKADEHAFSHVKRVVDVLDQVARSHPFKRVVLAGATDATAELFRLLPKSMKQQVVASPAISANAPENEILDAVASVAAAAERTQEVSKVETLLTAAAKHRKAVATAPETIHALNDSRVRELVYAEGFNPAGGVCPTCHAVFVSDIVSCEFCGMPVKPVEDLMEAALDSALAKGAAIEQVRGEAAEMLRRAGGLGAFLRF